MSDNNDCHKDAQLLIQFFDYAYSDESDRFFLNINKQLKSYYLSLSESLVLASKIACSYHDRKVNSKGFDLYDLYRAERSHYYDMSYLMDYIPVQYKEFFRQYCDESFYGRYEFR